MIYLTFFTNIISVFAILFSFMAIGFSLYKADLLYVKLSLISASFYLVALLWKNCSWVLQAVFKGLFPLEIGYNQPQNKLLPNACTVSLVTCQQAIQRIHQMVNFAIFTSNFSWFCLRFGASSILRNRTCMWTTWTVLLSCRWWSCC